MLCVLVEEEPDGKTYINVRNRAGAYRVTVVDERDSCIRRDWAIDQIVKFMIERGQG